jgi:hypothetical protein
LCKKRAIAQAEGDLPRASALLAPLSPAVDDTPSLETQVYQANPGAPPCKSHPSAKGNIDQGLIQRLGYLNGELRFWLGWAQEVAGDHAAAQEAGDRRAANWNLSSKNSRKIHDLIGDLALTIWVSGDKAARAGSVEAGHGR